jgi:hypothetical protein
MTNPMGRLTELKAQRAAIDAEINLIEAGISRAAYDGSLGAQLATVNDARRTAGKPTLTMTEFLGGDTEND